MVVLTEPLKIITIFTYPMTKKLIWWILVIVVVVGLWYGWKSGWLTNPNVITNNTTSTGGVAPTGGLSSKLTSLLQDVTTEAGFANLDAGESGLVTFVGQQVGDLSQAYDENQF